MLLKSPHTEISYPTQPNPFHLQLRSMKDVWECIVGTPSIHPPKLAMIKGASAIISSWEITDSEFLCARYQYKNELLLKYLSFHKFWETPILQGRIHGAKLP